jgi:phage baseplate assembly protein W
VEADFLGRGWAFPVEQDTEGAVALVAGEEDVRQAVRLILETEPGERVMRPDFGAGLRSLAFEPISRTTLALVRNRVEEALVEWDPAQGTLLIEIEYRVRETNTFYNLVYPFYLAEGRT